MEWKMVYDIDLPTLYIYHLYIAFYGRHGLVKHCILGF